MGKWKKTVNQRNNEWWEKGINKNNPLHLPKQWIHLGKDSYSGEWKVRAANKINPETISGKTLYFKSKPKARAFVLKYIKSN